MQRIAFTMKLHSGKEAEYRRRHDAIWPELSSLLKEAGIEEYSIFLEEATGVLFSGDAVYDGPLLEGFYDGGPEAYIATMERLRELPVRVVHGGHEASFGRDRLVEICDAFLRRTG